MFSSSRAFCGALQVADRFATLDDADHVLFGEHSLLFGLRADRSQPRRADRVIPKCSGENALHSEKRRLFLPAQVAKRSDDSRRAENASIKNDVNPIFRNQQRFFQKRVKNWQMCIKNQRSCLRLFFTTFLFLNNSKFRPFWPFSKERFFLIFLNFFFFVEQAAAEQPLSSINSSKLYLQL